MDAVAHSMWKHGNDIVLLQETKMASDHNELRIRKCVHGRVSYFWLHGKDGIKNIAGAISILLGPFAYESWKRAGRRDIS